MDIAGWPGRFVPGTHFQEGLASATAGHRQEAPQGVEALLGDTVQEGVELFLRPDG
jgi:hypothetical protein